MGGILCYQYSVFCEIFIEPQQFNKKQISLDMTLDNLVWLIINMEIPKQRDIIQSNQQPIDNKMTVNKQVLDLLRTTLATTPKIQDLHLDFMHINDLLPYMQLLSQLKNLKSLSLYGNRIKELPMDMSALESVEMLDISNNLLNDIDLLVVSLQSLPKLRFLKFPVKKEKQGIIIESVKRLESLNDIHIVRQASKKAMSLRYMNQPKLNQFKKEMLRQFRKVRQVQQSYLNQKPNQNSEQKFTQQMQNLIKQSLRKLSQKQGQLTQSLQILYFNKTKYDIYDTIRNRYINIAMDIYGDLGKMIKEVWDFQLGIFEAVVKESLKLIRYEYEMLEMQRDRRENGSNLGLENKIYVKNQYLEKELKRIKKQKDELIIEINQLQSQNKRYLQSLVRYSKGDKSGFVNLNLGSAGLHAHSSRQNPSQSFTQNFVGPNMVIKPLQKVGGANKSANITKQSIPSNYLSNGRNLTLKQLKDTIQEIYESKLKFDQKNFDGKIPRETMHQYLFTYLNQKYGLKNLTIEAASSIVGGIQAYSGQDNDVAVFGKIMKNEVDQQFRNVQVQLKTTINNLLKMHIKTQVPFKSVGQIDNIFKQKINGEISAQEIEDIVKYLYNKTDSDRILHKMEILYKLNKPKQQQPTNRRLLRDQAHLQQKQRKRLKFTTFLQAVLDFQLKNHERLLKPLVVVFKSRDRDSDGIVNEEEFISIAEELCDEAKDILPEMLMIVDPYETKSITFTQVVRLMANFPENNPILSRYIDKEISQDLE